MGVDEERGGQPASRPGDRSAGRPAVRPSGPPTEPLTTRAPLTERANRLRAALVAGIALAVVGILAVVVFGAGLAGLLPGWFPSPNPFRETTTDRTGTSVLQSLTDLSEYRAASAHYETVVDIDNDTDLLPDFISGERVLYVGKGDVDAVVDFGELDERRVQLSEDGTAVTVTLPAPVVSAPVLDLDDSYVAYQGSGIVNRLRGSDLEREAQRRAVQQMAATAAGEEPLLDKAKENTTTMLRGLFGALGYTDVTVRFDEDPR